MISAIAFMVNVGLAVLNLALYLSHGELISLCAAIFCGAIALFVMVMEATS